MSSKIMLVLSSVRPGRMADRVAKTVSKAVSAQGLQPVILDPLQEPFELVKVPLHFNMDPEKDAPKWMHEVNNKIKEAAGYIVISAEYNAGIPPALSNMLSHFPITSYIHKPAGIVNYSIGPHAGVRAQIALRPFLSELGLVTIPCKNVAIHNVHMVVDEAGNCDSEWINGDIATLVKDVQWYANALGKYKSEVPPPPPKVYKPKDFGAT